LRVRAARGWVDGEAPVAAFWPVISSPPPADPDLPFVTESAIRETGELLVTCA
jgi:hypothetical protein